jgi:hypothetical protein
VFFAIRGAGDSRPSAGGARSRGERDALGQALGEAASGGSDGAEARTTGATRATAGILMLWIRGRGRGRRTKSQFELLATGLQLQLLLEILPATTYVLFPIWPIAIVPHVYQPRWNSHRVLEDSI